MSVIEDGSINMITYLYEEGIYFHLPWTVHNKDNCWEKVVLEAFPLSQSQVVEFSSSSGEYVQECICNSKICDENGERSRPNLSFSKRDFHSKRAEIWKEKPHTMYPVVYEESADALQNIEWNAEGSGKEVEFFNEEYTKKLMKFSWKTFHVYTDFKQTFYKIRIFFRLLCFVEV